MVPRSGTLAQRRPCRRRRSPRCRPQAEPPHAGLCQRPSQGAARRAPRRLVPPSARPGLAGYTKNPMSPDYKLSEIRQIAITVSDVGVALPFYRDVLGLTFLFSPAPTLAFLAAGSVRIMLSIPQGAGTVGQNSILYFKVTDIVTAHAAIVARG